MGGKAMVTFRNRILYVLPVVALMWSLQPPVAQAQFMQQGPKLVGTGAIGPPFQVAQGHSVSLSGDGNTAIVGGPGDCHTDPRCFYVSGAAWVFTRTGGGWSQEAKLVGTGVIGLVAAQGWSVSLSGDGNTAIVGGPADGPGPNSFGAAWVFTRSGGVWARKRSWSAQAS
jgi:hypothetical protein